MLARAPGKLFIAGEYAVLYGGIALVAAVDRYVEVRRSSGSYEVIGAPTERKLPEIVASRLGDQADIDLLEVDVSPFSGPDGKYGLGSSAASSVAIVRAICPSWSARRVFDVAYGAHREFQGDAGSGADVAASTYGGLLGYSMHRDHLEDALVEGEHLVRSLQLPEGVRLEAIWTGASQKTTSMMSKVRESMGSDLEDVLQRIAESSARMVRACRKDEASEFLRAFASADELTLELTEKSGAPVVTETHRELRELASRYGFHAKPSGAGGGEFSLVAGPTGEEWDYLLGSLKPPLRFDRLILGAAG